MVACTAFVHQALCLTSPTGVGCSPPPDSTARRRAAHEPPANPRLRPGRFRQNHPAGRVGSPGRAFLSLDEGDNDLARFLAYRVAARQGIQAPTATVCTSQSIVQYQTVKQSNSRRRPGLSAAPMGAVVECRRASGAHCCRPRLPLSRRRPSGYRGTRRRRGARDCWKIRERALAEIAGLSPMPGRRVRQEQGLGKAKARVRREQGLGEVRAGAGGRSGLPRCWTAGIISDGRWDLAIL